MNPVNATALYVSASRAVLQCDPKQPNTFADMYNLLPFFRQSLACLVCGKYWNVNPAVHGNYSARSGIVPSNHAAGVPLYDKLPSYFDLMLWVFLFPLCVMIVMDGGVRVTRLSPHQHVGLPSNGG